MPCWSYRNLEAPWATPEESSPSAPAWPPGTPGSPPRDCSLALHPSHHLDEARDVTIPLHVLLQWDDEGNDRQRALDLFDAFGSTEKTLQANLGGHTGVPAFAGEDAARFFARHLTMQKAHA